MHYLSSLVGYGVWFSATNASTWAYFGTIGSNSISANLFRGSFAFAPSDASVGYIVYSDYYGVSKGLWKFTSANSASPSATSRLNATNNINLCLFAWPDYCYSAPTSVTTNCYGNTASTSGNLAYQ